MTDADCRVMCNFSQQLMLCIMDSSETHITYIIRNIYLSPELVSFLLHPLNSNCHKNRKTQQERLLPPFERRMITDHVRVTMTVQPAFMLWLSEWAWALALVSSYLSETEDVEK